MGHAKLDKNISRLAEKLKAAPPGSQSYNIVRKLRKKLRKQKRLKEEELKAQRIRQLNIQRALKKQRSEDERRETQRDGEQAVSDKG